MTQPNILLITTDQQLFRLMSGADDSHVSTPALDNLAQEGMRFDLTYCANPVCVPARYSLISGHMPHEFAGLRWGGLSGRVAMRLSTVASFT